VHFLRRSIGAQSLIAGNGDELQLASQGLWCDALAFEEVLDAGRVSDAIDLYQGDLLEGFHVGDAPAFEHWLDTERTWLANRHGKALEAVAEQREMMGDYEAAVSLWRRLASRDPYCSRVALRVMQGLSAAGDPAAAMRHAQAHEALLRDELQIEPDQKIQALVQQLHTAPIPEPQQRVAREQSAFTGPAGLPAPPRESVAVLPFLNLSPDPDQEYFAEGMTEEILNALAKVPGLKVASRTSALAVHRLNLEMRSIGDRLGVRTVLEGSVRRAGNRVRITAQLINVADGYHLWSETYDRELGAVFELQDQISHAIAAALELRLSPSPPPALVRSGTASLAAYELYLRGRYLWNIRTPDSLQKGIACFQRAIAADRSYALPHSGLADSYHLLALYGMMRAREAYPQARKPAARAVEIDPRMAEGHSSLGCIAFSYDHDWAVADREFRTALEINPTYTWALHWYAWFLLAMNRIDEAIAHIRRAAELEPLSPILLARTGHILCFAGLPEEGLRYCERALELDPTFAVAQEVSALIYGRLSRLPEATAMLAQLGTRQPSRAAPILLPYVHALVGESCKARELVDGLGYSPEPGRGPLGYLPLWICGTYALIGELDLAFRWLAYMYDERAFSVVLCNVVPGFENLRPDSRFREWLKRIGLPILGLMMNLMSCLSEMAEGVAVLNPQIAA